MQRAVYSSGFDTDLQTRTAPRCVLRTPTRCTQGSVHSENSNPRKSNCSRYREDLACQMQDLWLDKKTSNRCLQYADHHSCAVMCRVANTTLYNEPERAGIEQTVELARCGLAACCEWDSLAPHPLILWHPDFCTRGAEIQRLTCWDRFILFAKIGY